ncbi:MAG: very short patch repair endonuclease [Sulfuricaulis sp.]
MLKRTTQKKRRRKALSRINKKKFVNVDAATRSRMQAIRGRDTQPELIVRRLIHRMGFRYSLYRQDLPGRPDIVLPGLHKVIFVHGCFWHGHLNCRRARLPTKNADAWSSKIVTNQARDRRVVTQLARLGWKSLIVWECAISNNKKLEAKLARFLS